MKTAPKPILIAAFLTAGLAGPLAFTNAQRQAHTGSAHTTVNRRMEGLKYEVGYPTKGTARKLYDEMDHQRATQAYLWSFPAVSAASVRRGVFQDLGAGHNDIIIYEKFLDTKSTWFTGNTTTIYAVGIIDLAKNGPVVVEVPAGPTAGMLADFWFRTSGIGRLGPDKGNGGKYLLVPPGYKGDLPKKGFFVVRFL